MVSLSPDPLPLTPLPGTLLGLGEQVVTTKTLRRRFFSLAGRITRSARRLTLHLPQRWPWEAQFDRALLLPA